MPTQAEISLSPISAKGDVLSTDGSSRTRVAVGTDGQIFTARSSATSGVQFETAGGGSASVVLIGSATATTDVTTMSISFSYNTAYIAYYVEGHWRCTRTAESESQIWPNSTTYVSHFMRLRSYGDTTTPWSATRNTGAGPGSLPMILPANGDTNLYGSDNFTAYWFYFFGKFGTIGSSPAYGVGSTYYQALGQTGAAYDGTTTGTLYGYNNLMMVGFPAASNFTSIQLYDGNPSFSSIKTGTTVRLYGIKRA